MLVSVKGRDGSEMFSYSTEKDQNCLHPARHETPEVVEALKEAIRFLCGSGQAEENSGT